MELSDISCNITHQVLLNPSITKTGHQWETQALCLWNETSSKCPLTRTPMNKLYIRSELVIKIINGFINFNPNIKSLVWIDMWDQNKIWNLINNILEESSTNDYHTNLDLIQKYIELYPEDERIISIINRNNWKKCMKDLSFVLMIGKLKIKLQTTIKLETKTMNLTLKTLTHWVCAYSSPQIIIQYIEHQLHDFETATSQYWLPIHIICEFQTDTEFIKWFINRWEELKLPIGTKIESGGQLVHIICAHQTDPEIIKWIINKWVELGLEFPIENTLSIPRIICRFHQDISLILWIMDKWIELGLDLETPDNNPNMLHTLCEFQSNPILIRKVIERWIELDLSLTSTYQDGFNISHIIFQSQTDTELIKWIIEKWLELGLSFETKFPLAHIFSQSQTNSEFVKWFIEKMIENRHRLTTESSEFSSSHTILHLISCYQTDPELIKWFNGL
jgi:hypothetical protein